MIKVLDAQALMCYLEKEPGYEKVQELLTKSLHNQHHLWMTVINWGEVYYIIYREYGQDKAQEIAQLIETFPIKLIPIDLKLAKEAALLKAAYPISYADCFAAALAKIHKLELVTGDPEFKNLKNMIKILWI